jgi:nicotinamide-nucleotide amidase
MFFLPGVPYEMKAMFMEHVLPKIQARLSAELGLVDIYSHVWRCLGIWESELQRVMDPIEAVLPKNAYLGYRTRPPENHLTLYWKHEDSGSPNAFAAWLPKIREILKPWTYTEDNNDLEAVVGYAIRDRKWRVALAESCTGGFGVQRLTRIPGASDWVWGGYTTYQLEAKSKMLGVHVPSAEAAVSAECAESMARAVLQSSGCDIGASITGFLGPTGGTDKEPLGTIYLSVVPSDSAQKKGARVLTERLIIPVRTREDAQWSASSYLLNLVRRSLGEI